MATYTVSAFTCDQRFPAKLPSSIFVIASGTVTINPYSQTRLAISKLTNLFKGATLLRVMVGPLDQSGKYIVAWDNTNNSIKAITASSTEAAENASDVGVINWMAIGMQG